MGEVKVVRQATRQWLDETGVWDWSVQEKDISALPCFFDVDASFYLLGGELLITASGEDEVHLHAGDFITLPQGVACYCEVLAPLRVHHSGAALA
ncbi:MAG: hypothetical protein AUJ56_10255 [Zetaproteobacteria bacterium CG1_02_49_23]|nr:MAG: hypothetical protein AUJ56_10255 [Zetaproteobacteria bacterium CG1_02_49_23]